LYLYSLHCTRPWSCQYYRLSALDMHPYTDFRPYICTQLAPPETHPPCALVPYKIENVAIARRTVLLHIGDLIVKRKHDPSGHLIHVIIL